MNEEALEARPEWRALCPWQRELLGYLLAAHEGTERIELICARRTGVSTVRALAARLAQPDPKPTRENFDEFER